MLDQCRVGLQLLGAEGAVEQLFPCVLGSGMSCEHLHLLGTEDATGKWAGHDGARMEMFFQVGHQGGSRGEVAPALRATEVRVFLNFCLSFKLDRNDLLLLPGSQPPPLLL